MVQEAVLSPAAGLETIFSAADVQEMVLSSAAGQEAVLSASAGQEAAVHFPLVQVGLSPLTHDINLHQIHIC